MGTPTSTPAWKALQKHSQQFKSPSFNLNTLFEESTNRFANFSACHENMLLDFSKNYLREDTLVLLLDLARQCDVPNAIESMYKGEAINGTEQRAAHHVALRNPKLSTQREEIESALTKMEDFVSAVHDGNWTGYSGQTITDVVNIGIGGSDLGPAMVTDALLHHSSDKLKLHFVSNIDPSHMQTALTDLNPERTLFIVVSKSFTTQETHQNASIARDWFLDRAIDEKNVAQHFVAVTSNLDEALRFGIDAANLFPMWDWVGGRYSLWSAVGLSIALSIGMDNFRQLLAGAESMDQHFRTTPLEHNIPVLMALLTIWYTGFFDCHSSAVIPYSQRLSLLPAFLQQLYMESLGKCVDKSGEAVDAHTGEALWGTAGTNGQHSYFQMLHQGTQFIPVDFIAFAAPYSSENQEQHQQLLANCLSQSLALMKGAKGNAEAPHENVPGNRPSTTLLINSLNPFNLGGLLALYEHKVYVQSTIWNINAFDQWGVELGKQLSSQILNAMKNPDTDGQLDDSTFQLLTNIRRWNETEEND